MFSVLGRRMWTQVIHGITEPFSCFYVKGASAIGSIFIEKNIQYTVVDKTVLIDNMRYTLKPLILF